MEITSLKIMLPYLNDEYKVGKTINHFNQASSGENEKDSLDMGIVVEIENCADDDYMIHFDSGKYRMICEVPVLIDIEGARE